MKTITFTVATNKVGSKVSDTFTFEQLGIDENLTGDELENELNELWQDWIWNNIDGGYGVDDWHLIKQIF